MSTEGLNLPLLLILIAAPIGGFDVLYYHIYKFRLARRPESRAETRTHVLRSLILAAVAAILALGVPTGLLFWAVAGLFGLDVINSAIDTFLERDSRADLGGLPRLEYVIHMIGATLVGAIAATFITRGWDLGFADSGLAAADIPGFMQVDGLLVAGVAFLLAVYEAAVMVSSGRRAAEVAPS